MDLIFKRLYQVRKAAQRGKEITLAPGGPFQVGEQVIQFCDGFVLIVSKGTVVDESLLRRAITTPRKRKAGDGKATSSS